MVMTTTTTTTGRKLAMFTAFGVDEGEVVDDNDEGFQIASVCALLQTNGGDF